VTLGGGWGRWGWLCSEAGLRNTADTTLEGIVAKTRTQLNRRLPDAGKLPWPPFGKAWYAGCTTLIIGNSLKAGIRASPTCGGLGRG
jgi:hypothetical protein